MALRDKEQEDRIEEIGIELANPPTDVHQLLLLLDKAESILARVDQCPPQSTHTALRPSMKALISRDLLKHSNLDVKVAVTSCLSEITRVTAPDAPYDDELMKEIFELIVGSFKKLDEFSSRSFLKRVSILETVAKVRSCVLMLDLECDDLILDMFHHFLNTIRPKHSYTVTSSMETVMTLVIEESENISARLLSCVLDHLKIDDKNVNPSAKKLAEKVFVNCASKLKPYMINLFSDARALRGYSKIVAAVYHGNLGTVLLNEVNSAETQADDSKFSDRTRSDEPPQGSAKPDFPEKAIANANKAVANAENVVADTDASSKSMTSNGSFQMSNVHVPASKQKLEFNLVEPIDLSPGATKIDSGLNLSNLKGRQRKASGKFVNNHHNRIEDKKDAPVNTRMRNGRNMETNLSKDDSLKELKLTTHIKPGKINTPDSTPVLDSAASSVSLHNPNEHDITQPRKGRPPRSKQSRSKQSHSKPKPLDGSSNQSGHSRTLESSQMTNGDVHICLPSSNDSEVISASEKNLLQSSASNLQAGCTEVSKIIQTDIEHDKTHSRKGCSRKGRSRKGRLSRVKKYGTRKAVGKAVVDGTFGTSVDNELLERNKTSSVELPLSEPSSNKSDVIISETEKKLGGSAENRKTIPTAATRVSDTKLKRHGSRNGSKRKVRDADLSGQKQINSTKKQKGGVEDEEDKEVKLKELVLARKAKIKEPINDHNSAKDSNETKSSSKYVQDTHEAFVMKKRRKSRNSLLVGSKIRVWWPEDESYYEGVVSSYDRSTKRHQILYDDGDVEVLFLKKEKWEPVEAGKMTDGVQVMNAPVSTAVNAPESNKKLKKGRPRKVPSMEAKTELPSTFLNEAKTVSPLKSSPDSTPKDESNNKVPKRKGRPRKVLTPMIQNSAQRHRRNNPVTENVDRSDKEMVTDKIPKRKGRPPGKTSRSRKQSSARRRKRNSAVNESAERSEKVGIDTPKSPGKVDVTTLKRRSKSKGDSPNSRKQSGDANDSGINPNEQVSLTTDSAKTRPIKLVRRPAKSSGQKARGSKKTEIDEDLNANGAPPKAGKAEASSSSGVKRKRGRPSR